MYSLILMYDVQTVHMMSSADYTYLSVCLSCCSVLREGKDAYIPVAFGQSVDVYLVSK